MKRSTKYVALDVHQESTVAAVREENGRVIARAILPTEEAALLEFFRGMRGSVHVAFEEGTQAQWLHDLLVLRVHRVVVCDRRGERRQGNKGDRVDADLLSDRLRRGGLRSVYHGSPHRAALNDFTRTYRHVVDDATRVMQRLKALNTIPFLGPVRVSLLLAIMRTPWRFRTKRNLWSYAGLAVVTHTSSEYALVDGRPVRRRRAPKTRGLNRNHNRVLKDIFKGAATAATGRPGALQDLYYAMIARGMDEDLARVTLTRKLAALTLRLWKRGERYDPTKLTMQEG